jgi:MoaA/NifB/PqqE/SkfB family radical SAM enzyme
MTVALAARMLRSTDKRLLWKFAYNFGWKGMLSVQKFKRRLKRGEVFPAFLYISIINSCNLRCRGCWVDVAAPQERISLEDWNRLINSAKARGNRFFGILGGEPFLHPELMQMIAAHPDCYFQIFTNGQPIDDAVAAELRRLGNVTPLISVEGLEDESDVRRGRTEVLDKTLAGIEACVRQRLITGVASSICATNFDELVNEDWVERLIQLGVHYCWFHTYRAVGPDAAPELALSREQLRAVRQFAVRMRNDKPIGFVDAYWDDQGQALCPAATGISHHISPTGDVEPCPIVQFACEHISDNDGDIYATLTGSELMADFRRTAAGATRGCIVLERPDLLKQVVTRNGARDTTARGAAMAELEAMSPYPSQHDPGHEVPERHWVYRFAKKHWFFGFGAYT